MLLKFIFIFLFIFLLNGCGSIPPLDKWAKGVIGRPIIEIKERMARSGSYAKRINWKEITYKQSNGNMIFVEPEPHDYILWEVDSRGIIVGYKVVRDKKDIPKVS
jgi:hypothetical protein